MTIAVERELFCGNDAMSEAAIQAGCRCYFGYPITPQNEVTAYMAKRMPEVGGVFLQAESEVAAINMVFGAASVGVRAMTSSSSPGISLKQEGISYLAGCELPSVIVNVQRGGPGLGSIGPSQSDYYQATRGGGHGDYRTLTLAPSTVQELVDHTMLAFDIADEYRNPTLVLSDGILGQMMEPVIIPRDQKPGIFDKSSWALDGAKGRNPHIIRSLFLDNYSLEQLNRKIARKFELMEKNEIRFDEYLTNDAEIVLVAFGSVARVCKSAVNSLRSDNIKAGLFRPITLWPYPYQQLLNTVKTAKAYLDVEMNMGQMIDDVRIALQGARPVHFFGRCGGVVITVEEVIEHSRQVLKEAKQ
jgi:2-oxoglutarate/2-oxoacid ferredoxin oxidoreductase subunit alpha